MVRPLKEVKRDQKIISYVTIEEKEEIILKAKNQKCTIAQLIRLSIYNLGTNNPKTLDIKRLKPPPKIIIDKKQTNNFSEVVSEMKELFFKGISLKTISKQELEKIHSFTVHKAIVNKTFIPAI